MEKRAFAKGWPVVEQKNFIMATREIGYRSLAEAVAELVDNSIQAAATEIQICLWPDSDGPVIQVLDNGCGMDLVGLRSALQFGGTNRFNDRRGLGRFGMGLPCSSVSQAGRVDVYSWQKPGSVHHSYLDVDDIAEGRQREIPKPRRAQLPVGISCKPRLTGTLVVWSRCERIDSGGLAVARQLLQHQLGRIFRYLLWDGIRITVNDQPVLAVDPLYCNPDSMLSGATEYGDSMLYRIRIPGKTGETSSVRVRFSELPVSLWRRMPVEDKRRFGIVKGAGVSLVRARREIAYGWYFMGEKRKENYDDWWRCEIAFGPELDEYFRPTHTKQEVHPSPELQAVLTSDIEAVARILNSRVRRSFLKSKRHQSASTANRVSALDKYLPPLAYASAGISKGNEVSRSSSRRCDSSYSLTTECFRGQDFYAFQRQNGILELKLNKDHAFFDRIYAPLCTKSFTAPRKAIECLMFALIRAEAEAQGGTQQYWYNRKRTVWSNVLATFLGS